MSHLTTVEKSVPQESNEVEELAREFHTVYQKEAKRQGMKRHPDDYDSLSEQIKEFDRVLARHVLDKFHPKQDNKNRVGRLIFDENVIAKEYGGNILGCDEIVRKEENTIGIGSEDGGFIYLNKDEALALANWIKEKCK